MPEQPYAPCHVCPDKATMVVFTYPRGPVRFASCEAHQSRVEDEVRRASGLGLVDIARIERHGDERLHSDDRDRLADALDDAFEALCDVWDLIREVWSAILAVLTEPYREFRAHGFHPFTSHRKRFLRDR